MNRRNFIQKTLISLGLVSAGVHIVPEVKAVGFEGLNITQAKPGELDFSGVKRYQEQKEMKTKITTTTMPSGRWKPWSKDLLPDRPRAPHFNTFYFPNHDNLLKMQQEYTRQFNQQIDALILKIQKNG